MSNNQQQQQQQQQQPQQQKHDPNPLQLPTTDRELAACRRCHRILTQTQFIREGCGNCREGILRGQDLRDKTTQQFHGHVGIIDSRRSWIARLIGCQGAPAGVYAARVAKEQKQQSRDVSEM